MQTASPRCSPTWCATRSTTRRRVESCRSASPARPIASRSRFQIRASGSQRRTSSTSSSGCTEPTAHAREIRAGLGSDCPSRESSSRRWVAACRQLRSQASAARSGSARGDVSDRVTGLQVGADDYLGKPFSIVELAARVGSLLRRVAIDSAAATSDTSQPATFGNLVLDFVGHRATLAGSELDLSRREMDLLELLLQHPGRTFSREFLLERLWGADFDGLDRAVDTRMVRLRRKLGDLGACIETVWGVGYRFRPDLRVS